MLLLRDCQLDSQGGESAVFVHSGGQVLTQGTTLQGAGQRLLAVESSGVFQQLELHPTTASVAVMELLSALAGPKLKLAKDRMAAWTAAELVPSSGVGPS